MRIEEHWSEIQQVVARGQSSTIYCSIASVAQDGTPNIAPVGTVFLRDNFTGYYFDQYTSALAKNLDANPSVCVMAVNAGRWFWFRSFWLGRFISPPGVRLYGTAGPLRRATPDELRLIEARVRPTRWLKGNRLLWSDFKHVRDITFTSFRPIMYPKMMDGLWNARIQQIAPADSCVSRPAAEVQRSTARASLARKNFILRHDVAGPSPRGKI